MALLINLKLAKKSDFYNPEFVAKIKESRKQIKEGKVTYLKTSDLWK